MAGGALGANGAIFGPIPLVGCNGVLVQLSGTYNLTVIFEATVLDPTTGPWVSVNGTRTNNGQIDTNPAVTLSWIRELPALGEGARPMLRRGFGRLAAMIVELSTSPGFQRAGLAPLSPTVAVILVGGLRELTAQTVEDGSAVTGIIGPAVAASIALLSSSA